MQYHLKDEKVIFLGDTHFGARNDSQLFHDFFEVFFEHLFAYMLANNIKTIVQFGDLFDRRKYVNFVSLKRAREYFFDKCRKHGFTVYVFLGNHDVSYKNTLDVASPVLLLKDYTNIHVMSHPTIMQLGNTKTLCVPWICADNYTECVDAIQNSDADLCLGHFEIQGFEMYKGAVCDHGLEIENFWKFRHVYSGHFHHISTKGNITYIGSPYQIMWSDYGDERGFFVLDTTSGETEFVVNPYQMFFKLFYDDTIFTMEEVEETDFSVYNSRYVKVIVKEKNDLFLYDRFIEKLDQAGAIVSTVQDHHNLNIETDEEIASEAEEIDAFIKRMCEQYSGGVVDSNKLTGLMMELYTEATNLSVV